MAKRICWSVCLDVELAEADYLLAEQIDTAPAGSAEPDDESEEVDPSEESDGSFVEQQAAQNEGDHNDVDSVSQEELLAGSEVDITAAEEVLEEDPDPNKPVDKSEKAPYEVPVGAFWLHDDRLDEDAGQRWASRHSSLTLASRSGGLSAQQPSQCNELHLL